MARQPGLVDVLASAAAGLGVNGFHDSLGFGDVQHAVVCLLDGVGWRLLQEYGEHAPTLTAAAGFPIASVFPTTTPSALGSMGTGLLPGAHGLVGASFLLPETNQVLWPLKWKSDASPIAVQPESTIFEVVARQGVEVASIGPAAYEQSGLTRACLRGARYLPAEDIAQRVRGLLSSTSRGGRTLTYIYWAEVDRVGHGAGAGSAQWIEALGRADSLVAALHESLPANAAMLITADHGMVNCPPASRIAIESHPDLTADVLMIAGEPRVRHVYSRPMHRRDVAARWSERLGDRARVYTRDQLMAAGLYGPTDDELAERIGDVIAVAEGTTSMTSVRDRRSSGLIGQHGALTLDEWEIPAVMVRGSTAV